jgi:hypothetical protein
MAVQLKDKKVGTLILIALLGIIMGAYMNELVVMVIPDSAGVVKKFFTAAVMFGIPEFDWDLAAIKLQFGIQFKFTMLSILGVFLSRYFFRWYR